MTFEEYKKEVDKNINNLFSKANEEERKLLNNMIKTINEMCEKEQNLITFLKSGIKMTTDFRKDEEDDMFYLGKIRAFQQVLSKIESSDK